MHNHLKAKLKKYFLFPPLIKIISFFLSISFFPLPVSLILSQKQNSQILTSLSSSLSNSHLGQFIILLLATTEAHAPLPTWFIILLTHLRSPALVIHHPHRFIILLTVDPIHHHRPTHHRRPDLPHRPISKNPLPPATFTITLSLAPTVTSICSSLCYLIFSIVGVVGLCLCFWVWWVYVWLI